MHIKERQHALLTRIASLWAAKRGAGQRPDGGGTRQTGIGADGDVWAREGREERQKALSQPVAAMVAGVVEGSRDRLLTGAG